MNIKNGYLFLIMLIERVQSDKLNFYIKRRGNGDVFASSKEGECLDCQSKTAKCLEERSQNCCKGCQCSESRTIVFDNLATRYGQCLLKKDFDLRWPCYYRFENANPSTQTIPLIQSGVRRIGAINFDNVIDKSSQVYFVHYLFEGKWAPYKHIDFYVKEENGKTVLYFNTTSNFKEYAGNILMLGLPSNCLLLKAAGSKEYEIKDGKVIRPTPLLRTQTKLTTSSKLITTSQSSKNSSIVSTNNTSLDEIYIIAPAVAGVMFLVLFLILFIFYMRKRGYAVCFNKLNRSKKQSQAALIRSIKKSQEVRYIDHKQENDVIQNKHTEVYTQLSSPQSSDIQIYHNLNKKKKQSTTSDYIAPNIAAVLTNKEKLWNENIRSYSDANVAYKNKPKKNPYSIPSAMNQLKPPNNELHYSAAYLALQDKEKYQEINQVGSSNYILAQKKFSENKSLSLPIYKEVDDEQNSKRKLNENFYSPLANNDGCPNQYKELNHAGVVQHYKQLDADELRKNDPYQKLVAKRIPVYKELEIEHENANTDADKTKDSSVYEHL